MLQNVADCCHAQASEGAAGALLQFSPNGKYLACVAAAPTSPQEASAGAAVTHGGVHGSTQVRESPCLFCDLAKPPHRSITSPISATGRRLLSWGSGLMLTAACHVPMAARIAGYRCRQAAEAF